MKKLLYSLFLCLVIVQTLGASDAGPTYIPNTVTVAMGANARLFFLHLANSTSGAVTVTINDRSNNCNNGPCPLWPTVSIAGNTVYITPLNGILAVGGFTWQASAANSVVGWISYQP